MNWVSYHTDYEENKNLESGKVVKRINWLDDDYQKFFSGSGFEVVEKLNPLGRPNDQVKWESELEHFPYTVYVLKKLKM
jgi:hypothetical protein